MTASDSRPPVWRLALAVAGAFLLVSPFLQWANLSSLFAQNTSLFDLWSQPSSEWADTSIKGDFTGILAALVLAGVVLILLAALRMRWRTAAWGALGAVVVAGAVAIPLSITVFKRLGVGPSGTGLDLAVIGLLAALVVALVGVVLATLRHTRPAGTAAGAASIVGGAAGGGAAGGGAAGGGPAQW